MSLKGWQKWDQGGLLKLCGNCVLHRGPDKPLRHFKQQSVTVIFTFLKGCSSFLMENGLEGQDWKQKEMTVV